MAELGMIDAGGGPVKVLARGEIGRAVTVEADAFSAAARSAIEAAGGSAATPEKS
jgi:large subunit ribosomal protein L15